ncbi:NACHT domain-containing protein [Porphyromonas loveana]|uniref:NACHT domain-containing protein n=1 Tax=Porphyromonas loveana TaxID=1884669 RepID=UPI00359FE968
MQDLKQLFNQYGYQLDREEESNILVFSLKTSTYPAVEMVLTGDVDKKRLEELHSEYSKIGYAVHVCEQTDLLGIENYLFNRFFNVEISNQRILQRYEDYTEELMSLYDKPKEDYSYISIPYSLERNFEALQGTLPNLTSSLLEVLNQEGPQFVIIEAAAGFGKTSTAYELLKEYVNQKKQTRPFLMELSKDRRANNFRYLLLSQIDQNFDIILKQDIVIHNIKRGRIPLIIDGFDELLSKDLDNGAMDAKFDDVETMLSTIGELLTDNSKVILTTRKTAIFSGESFYEWYMSLYEKSPFSVSRYQLYSPSVNDWLSPKDLEERNIRQDHLKYIANPVLLAYLRYCSTPFENSESLVDHYFEFLLKREIRRQEIPFSKAEQLDIFQKLSTYFSGFNITSEKRSDIKSAIAEYASPYIKNYALGSKDAENIINALTNHALLDRKEEKVGFLNDFVLGFLLMEAFIHYSKDREFKDFLKETSYSFLDKSLIAAAVRCENAKRLFWEVLQGHPAVTIDQMLRVDLVLTGKTQQSISVCSFTSETFLECLIGTEKGSIRECTFSSVNFISCTLDFNFIEDCAFVNCKFENCEFKGSNDNNHFWNCIEIPNSFLSISENEENEENEGQEISDIGLQLQVLENFFQVDKRTRRMRLISRLRKEMGLEEKNLKKVLGFLEHKRMILFNGDKSFISDEGARFYFEHKYER